MIPKKFLPKAFKQDLKTLKTLNSRQKIRFIFDYYKGQIFAMFVCLLFLFYIGDFIYQGSQVIVLQGFFINDRQNLFPAEELISDFSAYQKTPPDHRICFEDSLYVTLGSSSQYNTASQEKIVSYVAAKQLDFLIAPQNLAAYYADSFLLYDLNELLPEHLKDGLKEDFYYAKDGTDSEKACGLNLRRSNFLKNPVYDGAEDYVLLVLSYTPRTDAVVSFIEYAYH